MDRSDSFLRLLGELAPSPALSLLLGIARGTRSFFTYELDAARREAPTLSPQTIDALLAVAGPRDRLFLVDLHRYSNTILSETQQLAIVASFTSGWVAYDGADFHNQFPLVNHLCELRPAHASVLYRIAEWLDRTSLLKTEVALSIVRNGTTPLDVLIRLRSMVWAQEAHARIDRALENAGARRWRALSPDVFEQLLMNPDPAVRTLVMTFGVPHRAVQRRAPSRH